MPANDHQHGIQVGAEVYNLVVSAEDLEKRRLDRERAKKLSQETNRRRKALEDRKRLAEERENRKIELELVKRRQRQIEATERYQRSHVANPRVDRNYKIMAQENRLSVENVLQQLRSGDSNDDKSHEAFLMSSANERLKFEFELEEQQRMILQQHRNQVMKEFTSQLHSDSAPHASALTTGVGMTTVPHPHNNMTARNHNHTPSPDRRLQKTDITAPRYVDLMSGRMQEAPKPAPAQTESNFTKLADSLTRLFDGKDTSESMTNGLSNGLHIEDADDIVYDSLDVSKPQMITNETKKSDNADERNDDCLEVYDDQDSLHGSSNGSSAPSPRQMNNGDYTDAPKTQTVGSALFRTYEKSAPKTIETNNIAPMATHGVAKTTEHSTLTDQPIATQVSSSHSDTSLPIYKGVSVPKETTNYYVKSYRPWSASVNNTPHQSTDARPISAQPYRVRPASAKITQPSNNLSNLNETILSSSNNKETPASSTTNKLKVHFERTNSMESDRSDQVHLNNGVPVKANVKWGSPVAKTTATPISAMFTPAWDRESPVMTSQKHQRNIIMLARQTQKDVVTMPTTKSALVETGASSPRVVAKEHIKPPTPLKGILRKISKYESPFTRNQRPSYQSASVAKDQWVQNINISMQAKLNGTPVRDSLETPTTDGRVSPSKNVSWNEIRYNDGTFARFAENGSVIPQEAVNPPSVAAPKTTSKKKGAKPTPPAAKAKPAVKAPAKGAKKGGAGKGRKLKVAKDIPLEMEPRPPPPPQKKELTMSTVLNYSISGTEHNDGKTSPIPGNNKPSPTQNRILFHTQSRVAWEDKDVTMDTLKSGSISPSNRLGNVLVNQGNQVTIHVVSPEDTDKSNIPLNKTPTDQEITWLWDKVRTCLNSTRNIPKSSRTIRKSYSDTGRENYYGRKSLHSAPHQTSANIVSIDGGMLKFPSHQNIRLNKNRRKIIRPNSASVVSNSVKKQATEAYSSYAQRSALQRNRQKSFNRASRPDGIRSATYPNPRPSGFPPSPPSSGRIQPCVSDSLAAFLLAETLAEQNMSEDEIVRAMESLKRKTEDAQRMGHKVTPSALSMEEQKLVASLERLNSRLNDVQSKVSNNPHYKTNGNNNQVKWADYTQNRNQDYTYVSRGHAISADSRYRTSRIRY